jgi:hypothetical protein
MVELIYVLAFLVMTFPTAMVLVLMATGAAERTPEWKPSPYQPMEMLMAQQKAARDKAAASPAERLAA